MDGFNSREFYGHSLSEDPKLRTTTRNYEFKYNSPEHLEKIITRVRTDREKKQMNLLDRTNNDIQFPSYNSKPNKPQVMKIPAVETQIDSSNSREAVVKIMSDEEIEAMIAQALHSTDDLPYLPEVKTFENIESPRETKNPVEIRKDEKLSKTSIEVFPNLQPQWVEIKPVQKSIANLFEPVEPCDKEDSSDSEDSEDLCFGLNLGDETLKNENEDFELDEVVKNKNKYFHSLSIDSRMTSDFIIRNQESADQSEDNDHEEESPLQSPVSLGVESRLNVCEHMEMERVFGETLPLVPKMQFEDLENEDKSDLSEFSADEGEKEEIKSQNVVTCEREDFENRAEGHIQPANSLSFRRAEFSAPKSSKSVKKSPKLQKTTPPLSANKKTIKFPVDGKLNIQIEDLKKEKLRIFSKMTSIQQKIIKSLDELRISLVEISLPDSEAEKKIRERNALEFAVRFSRNYLFPLGKMIDDLQLSPKEEYRSALTNEPCVKVCGIFGLLCQAVQCYQKQLRHFFTDSFPKKLDKLLNLIKESIKICLEKQIFDKRDYLIQSLLSRCEIFLEFVMEFAEKKKSARTQEKALQSDRMSRYKLPKTSSKWDLTMNLNNLNMYEPKLVQKKTKKSLQKKTLESIRQKGTPKQKKPNVIPKGSTDHVALPIEDPIETQVRKDNYVDSVQLINDAIAEQPDSDLAKAVIETLQDITKDEVHQMFGPIVSNLDSILNSSDNPQITVESVLNVLKSKFQLAKDNQLKIDDIATENITQNNNNTYQKEVTKKGTHSSRNKQQNQQQQQQFKETRQNIVSKTKTKVTSCRSKNVKEDSKEQTERHNSRSELTDSNTICDKQSLRRNIDADIAAAVSVAAAAAATFVSENNSMKQQKTTTNSGAFLSAIAAAAKKPTPASDTKNNEVGGIAAAAALPPTSTISKVKLDDVMPPPLQKSSLVIMTSESATDNMPVGLPRLDKFVSESHHKIIGDGKHRKEDAASQRNVRDGAANAIDRAEDNQEAWRKNLPAAAAAAVSSPVRNEPTKSGEMEKLMYRKNALYTFIKYLESGPTSQNKQDKTENLNDNLENLHISNEDKTQEEDDEIQQEKEDNLENVNKFNPDLAKCNCGEKQLKEQLQNETDIKAILDERNAFIKRCKNDPFYNNPQFPQPWKVLSKISKVIAHEIVDNFENDLSFGEESYVRDFINMETQN